MGVELRLPQITGSTEKEQLLQIKSYIYQLREQLQFAFDTINTTGGSGNGSYVVNQARGFTSSSGGLSSSEAELTFSALKSLIIKSADIVDAYYEEINKKLEGVYVAESDFGIYAEKTSQEIEANSTAITQNFENTQIIIRDAVDVAWAEASVEINDTNSRIDDTNSAVENLDAGLDAANQRLDSAEGALQDAKDEYRGAIQVVADSLSATDKLLASTKEQLKGSLDNLEFIITGLREIIVGVTAYIKSGLLYYTDAGIPVYGIEIGQEVEANGEKVFNKFSRFTSEKLSFYDNNGNEVAYISDKKLYIGQAEITISLKVGGLVDLVLANGDVVTKWAGG
jgi:hypothetical protein